MADPATEVVAVSVPAESPPAKATGRWVAGQSGNPKGRPPTRRERLLEAKQALEGFVRGKIDKDKAARAITKLVDLAVQGNVKAAAAILPYILSKATDEDAGSGAQQTGILIRIENATVKAKPTVVTEGEYKEISNG